MRHSQARKAVFHAAAGFALGLLVLHPVSMAVIGSLGVHSGAASDPLGADLVWSSFTVGIFPMGVVFGLIGMVVGAIDGYYRSVVRFQRDELARELALDEVFRRELEVQNERLRELEVVKRRSTRFLVHDLKNHLGCVLGFSELLLKRTTARRGISDREAAEHIHRQARQMLAAVLDLLDLARLEEAPRLDLDWADVSSMLLEALKNVCAPGIYGRTQLGERHPACAAIRCDRTLIVRVLTNLVINAVKHNAAEVNVMIDAAPGPNEVIFACNDDGPGIPSDLAPRLFDEFVTESDQARGYASGLGLAFCKAAVEAHGGRIWYERGHGGGNSFRFALPIGLEMTSGGAALGSVPPRAQGTCMTREES